MSPLFGPLTLSLADPQTETSRTLFSHFLWNASILLAEYLEEGPFPLFSVSSKSVVELGAGTGLAGMLANLTGAQRTVITDYPAEEVLTNIRKNVSENLVNRKEGKGKGFRDGGSGSISVEGHEWGVLDTDFAEGNKGSFERVLVADCLWMPWQHSNLRKSIAWFLAPAISPANTQGKDARYLPPSDENPYTPNQGGLAYVIAGFHTGRAKMAPFFDVKGMRGDGLVVERIWERNAEGREREWRVDRGEEDKDVTARKRWLVVVVVRRLLDGE
ncbi:hypothetical protein HYALB_00009650 [Hymenoscyphus albidus]|uniref:Uncharacterized protein n=1 Tax=Hymenoscyphus albidus TaxID=595503 RepID=A0A9N9LLB1_9HELO|nr:hypothetical protein HYALB_00009650 [Hymenoscyphus albidus]